MAKILDKLKEFALPTEENELELSKDELNSLSSYEHVKDEEVSNISANTDIVLLEPRTFNEASEIGSHIKNKRACCINLHHLPDEYRQRTIDFLSGVTFGVDGTIRKIGDGVILCSPKNLQVGGSIDTSTSNVDDVDSSSEY